MLEQYDAGEHDARRVQVDCLASLGSGGSELEATDVSRAEPLEGPPCEECGKGKVPPTPAMLASKS